MASKYDALRDLLVARESEDLTLTFARIEEVLGGALPASAYRHPAWWSNQKDLSTRPQARAWVEAGFVVDGIHQAGSRSWVRFRRVGRAKTTPPARPTGASTGSPRSVVEASAASGDGKRRILSGTPAPTIFLVSCVYSKQPVPAAAKDLYVSDWFRKARAFVEATGMPWFILSSQHGLIHPGERVAPYERTLNAMPVDQRRDWARQVIEQMQVRLPDAERVVVFAGARYREFLMEYLEGRFPSVEVPLEGLRIGEQLRWFTQRVSNGPA